jgi:hypothetical protein
MSSKLLTWWCFVDTCMHCLVSGEFGNVRGTASILCLGFLFPHLVPIGDDIDYEAGQTVTSHAAGFIVIGFNTHTGSKILAQEV